MHTFQRSPNYSEAAYFDGDHCHHCATRDEFQRLRRIERAGRAMIDRRHNGRARRP